MKETRFIDQNKEKWLESETLLTSQVKDPEKLSTLFTQVIDDLSYSRTYYPNRSVRVYLNKIARQYFSIIYSNHTKKRTNFRLFWLDELPQIILRSKNQLIISLLVFLLSAAIGVFSAYKDPKFSATILGESYITMTKENIDKGDPMAVYKKSHQVDMFLGITLNNLMVAFRTYVFGVFLAIGTLALLLYNGVMVGCFQFFFIERGLFVESALTIWLHGTLEISSIILAGGAGLTLGSGLIFPGTYTRLQAFQLSAIRSLKLMLGIAPIFVLAAIIESFLTRYTDVPDIFRILIIALSAFLIIGYFVVYPWWKSKHGFEVPLSEVRLPARVNEVTSYSRIKNNAEIIKDTFLFYARFSRKLLPWIVVISLGSTLASFFLEREDIFSELVILDDSWWDELFSSMVFAVKTPTPLFILVNAVCTALILYQTMRVLDGEARKTTSSPQVLPFIYTLIMSAIAYTAVYFGGWTTFLLLCVFGLLLLIIFTQRAEECSLGYGISEGLGLFTNEFKQSVGLQLILLVLSTSFLAILSAPLMYLYTSILKWNFTQTDTWTKNIILMIEMFIKTISFYLLLPLVAAAFAYLYFSLKEISSAHYLKESIAAMGIRRSKNSRR